MTITGPTELTEAEWVADFLEGLRGYGRVFRLFDPVSFGASCGWCDYLERVPEGALWRATGIVAQRGELGSLARTELGVVVGLRYAEVALRAHCREVHHLP